MGSVNKVIIVGNLGRDPELRYTQSGTAVANFSVATTSRGGRNSEPQTEWHRIVVWDKLAELCKQYLSKGRQVYVEGRLQTRSWDDQQTGQKRYQTEVVARDVVFLSGDRQDRGPRPERGGFGGAPDQWSSGGGDQSAPSGTQDPPAPMDDLPPSTFNEDDDIPF